MRHVAPELLSTATALRPLPEAHVVLDVHGELLLANPAAARLLGDEHLGAPGAPVTLAALVADPATVAELVEVWAHSDDLRPARLRLVDGRELRGEGARLGVDDRVLVRLRPREEAPGSRRHDLGRRLQETARELREANRRVRTADEALQEYAQAVAHDIRSPLFAIQGLAELLEADGHVDEVGTGYLSLLLEATHRLHETTEALLAVARLDHESRPAERVELADVAREVVGERDDELRAAGAEVVLGELPPVAATPGALRQVLGHLLDNSLRHGRAGAEGRSLRIEITGRTVGRRVVVTVRDDGVGIGDRDVEDLFRIFNRGGDGPGHGVGLATCRRLVTAWGGTITHDPGVERGAAVVFTVPGARVLVVPEAAPSPTTAVTSGGGP